MRPHFGGFFAVCVAIQILIAVQWHRTSFLTPSRSLTEDHLRSGFLSKNTTGNISYPSLQRSRASHPHAGAVDEFGNFKYVHDPAILQKTRNVNQIFTLKEQTQLCAPVGYGPEGGKELGRELFGRHIQISEQPDSTKKSPIKVFCAIYTYSDNNHQSQAIRETWGRKCDGFMAASTETKHEDAIVHLLHAGGHQGMYRGIWQKVRSMLAYIYDNFLNDYDFFFLCGDDTYVIMENLKAFLTSSRFIDHAGGPTYPQPVYTGAWVHPFWLLKEGYSTDFYYMGGGAGYVLNRAAVKGLVELAWPTCQSQTSDSAEDVYMAECLSRHLNVTGFDARDDQERERFIPYDPIEKVVISNSFAASNQNVIGTILEQQRKQNPVNVRKLNKDESALLSLRQQTNWLQMRHHWTPKHGIDSISPFAISFHMVQPAIKMYRYEQLFYHRHNNRTGRVDNNDSNYVLSCERSSNDTRLL